MYLVLSLVTEHERPRRLPELKQQSGKHLCIFWQGYLQPKWPQGAASNLLGFSAMLLRTMDDDSRDSLKPKLGVKPSVGEKWWRFFTLLKFISFYFQITCNPWEMFLGKN